MSDLQTLEQTSRLLEPSSAQLKDWLEHLGQSASQFLDSLPTAPAYFDKSSPQSKSSQDLFSLPGEPFAAVLEEFIGKLCTSGIDTAGSRYFGYIPGGGLPSAAIADFIGALTNRYAGLYLASPAAVESENSVLQTFLNLFEFPQDSWGALTSGGSVATLAAILAARETRPREEWGHSTFYVSQLVHTAALRAIKTAGLDPKLVRTIPVDTRQKMDMHILHSELQKDQSQGLLPWIVVGSLGTAGAGSVDPLPELLAMKEKFGYWLHLDGAYGGFFALTPYGKELFKGSSEADSIVLDPHKSLFMPYGIGAVLVRKGGLLKQAFSVSDRVLADLDDPLHRSPADYSPELTRPMRAARVELSLRLFGGAPFKAALEEKLLLARFAYSELQKEAQIECAGAPELSIIAFRVRGEGDQRTEALLRVLLSRGHVHMSSIHLNGHFHIRICVLSFRSHLREVQMALSEIHQSLKLI